MADKNNSITLLTFDSVGGDNAKRYLTKYNLQNPSA